MTKSILLWNVRQPWLGAEYSPSADPWHVLPHISVSMWIYVFVGKWVKQEKLIWNSAMPIWVLSKAPYGNATTAKPKQHLTNRQKTVHFRRIQKELDSSEIEEDDRFRIGLVSIFVPDTCPTPHMFSLRTHALGHACAVMGTFVADRLLLLRVRFCIFNALLNTANLYVVFLLGPYFARIICCYLLQTQLLKQLTVDCTQGLREQFETLKADFDTMLRQYNEASGRQRNCTRE